ncbi:MAG: hypothetical protein QF652_06185 [Dehalococcoidia bacterium]|jgi:hypothetical protein|nr:hypothetical protein [Dehalococcoidia bacterium]|tara:strand:+ start:1105 stop:1395 length:291 start_codon:yes stop_codon:yes gene_type:complete
MNDHISFGYEVTMKVTYPDRVPTYRSVVIDDGPFLHTDPQAAALRALVVLNERLVSVEWKAGGGHEVEVTEVRGAKIINGAVAKYVSLHLVNGESK